MRICQKASVLSLILVFALIIAFFAPVYSAEAATAPSHTIVRREYTTYTGRTPSDRLSKPFPLYFVDGADDLPFVTVEDWAALMYFVNGGLGDEGYDLNIEYTKNGVILQRENEYTMTFDFDEEKIVFDDYNAFVHSSDDTTLIDLVSERGKAENGDAQLILRDKEASFDRYGDVMTVDLGAYGIPMIAQDGEYYMPLQTMNDFTLLSCNVSFIFNGQALYLASDDLFFDYQELDYTDIAYQYYDSATGNGSGLTGKRSDALAEYSYNELCLALDTFYGLKEVHDIKSFRELFWQIGYDEALSGESAKDADYALKSFIDFYLDDLHSVFNEYSWLTGLESISSSTGMANRKFNEQCDIYSAARDKAYPDGWLNYEEVGNTAYITFDSFSSKYNGSAFYDAKERGKMLDDTVGLVIYAHEQITREGSPIENVVLDLSNNTGGAVDAAVVVISWFLGDAPFSVKDMATGAMSTSVYRADINLDYRFDENDTVSDKNLYCLISPVSFSCGNLIPAAFKSSQKVTLLGRTSGGGSCVVQPMSTAYGSLFQISAAQRMSFLKNGSFYDIDQGVDPDYYIDRIDHFYDRSALTAFINGLF